MKFLYWNLKSNPNLETIIKDCIIENEVDIALFSEFDNVDFGILVKILKNRYVVLDRLGICEKVIVLYKKTLSLSLIREQHRYLIAELNYSNRKYLLTGVHLPSNNHSNSDDRKNEIRKIINDITSSETSNVFSSIVIGDMNASPFDSEMIGKDAFNAVLFKDIIRQSETVTYQDEDYRRFYNPIIDYIDETNKNYGSYYYNLSSNSCLYWYCYDQLLVRKPLMDDIIDYKYLKKINETNLIGNIKPISSISDHLPLLVNIKI